MVSNNLFYTKSFLAMIWARSFFKKEIKMKKNHIGSFSFIAFAGFFHLLNKDMSSQNKDVSSPNTDVSSANTDVSSQNTDMSSPNTDLSSQNTDMRNAKLLAYFITLL